MSNRSAAINQFRSIAITETRNYLSKQDAGSFQTIQYYMRELHNILIGAINQTVTYEAVRKALISGISGATYTEYRGAIFIEYKVKSDITGESAMLNEIHNNGSCVRKHAFFIGKDEKKHPLFETGVPAAHFLELARDVFNMTYAGEAKCTLVES